ncbi:hypothetical protein OAE68_00160 [Synechococcus sp. AH-551-A10]|nr:hypothetical protein [Synechococcus sp. AH-551-A10]MDB4682073.1 hypothetical protein [Synechococcus sp. AH-551-A10]
MKSKNNDKTTKKVSTNNIPAMLLAVDGDVVYLGEVVKGLASVQKEAKKIANNLSEEEIKKEIKNTIYIEGEKPTRTKENTVVIYHVPFKEKSSKIIKSFDIPEIDHSSINHIKIINQLILSVKEKIKDSEIILCTTKEFGLNFNSKIIKKVYPAADPDKPMYNRVKTYNTLIQYSLLGENVIFMDIDVMIVAKQWEGLAKLNFDVALTYRFTPNLVPINEGVIYCRSRSQKRKEFFAKYIQTYG